MQSDHACAGGEHCGSDYNTSTVSAVDPWGNAGVNGWPGVLTATFGPRVVPHPLGDA